MTAQVLTVAFRLPAQALVGQRIPKKLLVAQALAGTVLSLAHKRASLGEAGKWVVVEGADTHAFDPERSFAEDLEKNTAVTLYAKRPGWFTVPTPQGSYNPDWAEVVNADGTDRLYFVVETKSTLFDDALLDSEAAKIACGRQQFAAIAEGADAAKVVRATNVGDFSRHW